MSAARERRQVLRGPPAVAVPELPAPPRHPHGDPGPRSAARGELELAEIVYDYFGQRGPSPRVTTKVVRRKSQGMQALDPQGRAILETYAAMVESLGAMRCIAEGPGRGARISDGGAVIRVERSMRVRAIRDRLRSVTIPITTRGQADRPPGRPITLLALVDGVALWRRSLCEILEDHGWPRARRAKLKLGEALREAVGIVQNASSPMRPGSPLSQSD